MTVVLLSIAIFAVAMLIMAVGVIFKRPCLRGSCGGPEVVIGGESLSCATCPNRDKQKKDDDVCERNAGLPVIQ